MSNSASEDTSYDLDSTKSSSGPCPESTTGSDTTCGPVVFCPSLRRQRLPFVHV